MRQRRRLAVDGKLLPRAHHVAPVPLRGRRDAAGAAPRGGEGDAPRAPLLIWKWGPTGAFGNDRVVDLQA